tara:strand:+ start:110 stop:271 length:162 start_codon:yes stop_codon:yes gene_type:complete
MQESKTDTIFCYKDSGQIYVSFGNGISAKMPTEVAKELANAILTTANTKESIQ